MRLQALIQEKLDKEHLSIRTASKQVGITHTSLWRIMQGYTCTIDTLLKLSKWLGVTPTETLMDDYSESLAKRLTAVLAKNKKLMDIFSDALERIDRGEVDQSLITDLASYLAFKIKITEKPN